MTTYQIAGYHPEAKTWTTIVKGSKDQMIIDMFKYDFLNANRGISGILNYRLLKIVDSNDPIVLAELAIK